NVAVRLCAVAIGLWRLTNRAQALSGVIGFQPHQLIGKGLAGPPQVSRYIADLLGSPVSDSRHCRSSRPASQQCAQGLVDKAFAYPVVSPNDWKRKYSIVIESSYHPDRKEKNGYSKVCLPRGGVIGGGNCTRPSAGGPWRSRRTCPPFRHHTGRLSSSTPRAPAVFRHGQ